MSALQAYVSKCSSTQVKIPLDTHPDTGDAPLAKLGAGLIRPKPWYHQYPTGLIFRKGVATNIETSMLSSHVP